MTSNAAVARILVVDPLQAASLDMKGVIEPTVRGTTIEVSGSLDDLRQRLDLAEQFDLAVVHLPALGSAADDLLDVVAGTGLPLVVLVERDDEATRAHLAGKRVIDCLETVSPHWRDDLQKTVHRTLRNLSCSVLVVDDSPAFRQFITAILVSRCFRVLEAVDGRGGLRMLEAHPDLQLVVCDYLMPDMDGLEMTSAIRADHPRTELVVIGLTGAADQRLHGIDQDRQPHRAHRGHGSVERQFAATGLGRLWRMVPAIR